MNIIRRLVRQISDRNKHLRYQAAVESAKETNKKRPKISRKEMRKKCENQGKSFFIYFLFLSS
jgi:hypothetical protein